MNGKERDDLIKAIIGALMLQSVAYHTSGYDERDPLDKCTRQIYVGPSGSDWTLYLERRPRTLKQKLLCKRATWAVIDTNDYEELLTTDNREHTRALDNLFLKKALEHIVMVRSNAKNIILAALQLSEPKKEEGT